MKRILILSLMIVMLTSVGCNKNPDPQEQSWIECNIFPLDSYTGKINFYVGDLRKFNVIAFLEHAEDSEDRKEAFNRCCKIEDIEHDIFFQLTDNKTIENVEFMAGTAKNGCKLICDKEFQGVAAGKDLSHLFNVVSFAKFLYPDFLLYKKDYNYKDKQNLSEFMTGNYAWIQQNWAHFNGLLIESITSPDPNLYEYEDILTFTLSISFTGLNSVGVEEQKAFEGQFTFWPDHPGEMSM